MTLCTDLDHIRATFGLRIKRFLLLWTSAGPKLLQIRKMSPYLIRPREQKDTGPDLFYGFGPNLLAHLARIRSEYILLSR